MKSIALLFLLTGAICDTLSAQSNRRLDLELRFGVNCNLNNFNPFSGKNQKFPGVRIYGSAILIGQIKPWLTTSYGASVAVYNKSLGNNLNPLVSDIQIDFVNSLSIGCGWRWDSNNEEGPNVGYRKYLRTLNNAPYYNLYHTYDNSVFFSTNFLINNHHRNQTVGTVSLTFDNFSVSYYNDSAPPIEWFNLGDGFDRYWTGGVMLALHKRYGVRNIVELTFDQFTGYQPLVYEISNVLGMGVPNYNSDASATPRAQIKARNSTTSFNSSAYNVKIFLDDNYAFDAGILGSLVYKGKSKKRTTPRGRSVRSRDSLHFGLQDIIHINGHYSLHPNYDINRFYIGLTYNQFEHVR
ncbi:MAG: hypothetical protein IT259_03415 [Saprospiraceae bacterium]|nr:hypothetical protein [Saprospiraceae bacterium]